MNEKPDTDKGLEAALREIEKMFSRQPILAKAIEEILRKYLPQQDGVREALERVWRIVKERRDDHNRDLAAVQRSAIRAEAFDYELADLHIEKPEDEPFDEEDTAMLAQIDRYCIAIRHEINQALYPSERRGPRIWRGDEIKDAPGGWYRTVLTGADIDACDSASAFDMELSREWLLDKEYDLFGPVDAVLPTEHPEEE